MPNRARRSAHTTDMRSVTAPRGFLAAGTTCGIKPSGKPDMTLIVSDRPAVAAGTFTRNKLPGAPLAVTRDHLRGRTTRAVVCNAGIANDATGKQGVANALRTCELVAETCGAGMTSAQVLVASTGVIGPQLPMDKIERGVRDMAAHLNAGPTADAAAARGIMTTDLTPKSAVHRFTLDGKRVTLGGIAKGSGMIAPNMATMLVFLTTDLAVERAPLRQALKAAVGESFNRISVDGHTSPSDMVLLLANGAAGNKPITAADLRSGGKRFRTLLEHLTALCRDLAYQIVADGEGATRIFRVKVRGAASVKDADAVGRVVVNSPLVKAAVHGGDPNWGRIVTAAANSSAALTPEKLSLAVGAVGKNKAAAGKPITVFRKGAPVALDKPTAKRLGKLMTAKEVIFDLDLGLGQAQADWLGCDLSKEYVRINAEYTT